MTGYIVGDKYTNMTIISSDNNRKPTSIKYTNNKYDASKKGKNKKGGSGDDSNTCMAQEISNALRKKSWVILI